MSKKTLLVVYAMLFLVGCSFKPTTPLKNTTYTSSYASIDIKSMWWQDFNDTTLNGLVENALQYNTDLALALNNIELARVNLGLEKIGHLPSINYEGSALRANNTPTAPDSSSQGVFNIGAVLHYEIDLWGRVRNAVGAKRSAYMATIYDYEVARLSVAGNVVNTYFRLLFLKEQENILENTLQSYQDTLDFRQNQLDAGAIGSIVYYQARAQVDSAKSQLVEVEKQISSTTTALAILTGKNYDEILYKDINTPQKCLPTMPEIPNGVPSDLLLHRADVASALEHLKATNFLVGVERANYFPTFSLTGMFGYTSLEFDRLVVQNANTWNIGGSLVGPLLDFGRTSKAVDLANLSQNASFILYDKTLKNAFGETRNALVSRENSLLRQESAKKLMKSQKEVYDSAVERYDTGYSDHLELLDAQRQYLSAQLNFAASNLEVAQSVVAVYKALGGGFVLENDETKAMLNSKETIAPTSSTNPFEDRN